MVVVQNKSVKINFAKFNADDTTDAHGIGDIGEFFLSVTDTHDDVSRRQNHATSVLTKMNIPHLHTNTKCITWLTHTKEKINAAQTRINRSED